jgi:hypothetical protein
MIQEPAQHERIAELERGLETLKAELADVKGELRRMRGDLAGPDGVQSMVRELRDMVASLVRRQEIRPRRQPYPQRLTAQRFHLVSQHGEDGVLQAIFRAAGVKHRRFVELGCGMNGGNSGFLADELGWTGLMVDADRKIVRRMQARLKPRGVRVRRDWITREDIDERLAEWGHTGAVDLLSIDIDGNDIWVWEAITVLEPRVVAIEYNTAFGATRSVAVPYDPEFRRDKGVAEGLYYGASLAALAAVGARKGYRLVAAEAVNAFFVRRGVARRVPACPVERAWRLYPKDERRLAALRGDPVEVFAEQGLPIVEVS